MLQAFEESIIGKGSKHCAGDNTPLTLCQILYMLLAHTISVCCPTLVSKTSNFPTIAPAYWGWIEWLYVLE